jgi:hypothetical protein
MGKQLVDFFTRAKELGGIQGVVKFAMIAKVSASAAESMPDTPENLKKLEHSFAEMKKQLGK